MNRRYGRLRSSLVFVAVGGLCGATARYAAAAVVAGPSGTLLANVVGSVLLGAVTANVPPFRTVSERFRLFFATGFLSSLTTYSTFAVGTATATAPVAVGYVGATYCLGFAGVLGGRRLAFSLGAGAAGGDGR